MQYEHIKFHYIPLGNLKCGMICQGQRMVTINPANIMPLLNTNEIPDNESYQSIVCLQEVIDEDNHHSLVYFDIYIWFVGE